MHNVGDSVQVTRAIAWMSPIPGHTYTIATIVNVDSGSGPRLFYEFVGHYGLVPAELCTQANHAHAAVDQG